MGVVVCRRIGRKVERFQLLESNIEDDETSDNSLFHYTFPKELQKIIKKSEVWARLESHVIYAFSSKYALALYELISLRCNLKRKTSDVFPLEDFRALIGVEKGKLSQFKSLKQRAIDKAVLEVNALCPDFSVTVEPELTGRKTTAIRVSWREKTPEEQAVALKELGISKVGREARMKGIVERIVEVRGLPPPRMSGLTTAEVEEWRERFDGLDVDYYERLFKEWYGTQSVPPRNYKAAFFGWTKGRIERKLDDAF